MQMGNFFDEELAESCTYGPDFIRDLLLMNGYDHVYVPDYNIALSSRKIEGLVQIGKYKTYYQQNPVRFIKDFFNIQLLDSQAWLITEIWNKPQAMILASRAYGKSFLVVLFDMAKQMLSCVPWHCYIASGSSDQSATTFKKLEDIANDRIESLLNSSGKIFKNEVEINNAAGDGFSHSPAGFEYHLYNGSFTRSLSGNFNSNRGKRSSCVIFDESSFLSAELIKIYEAFCAIDKDFKTGVSDDGKAINSIALRALPREIPNQILYVSSASTTDTEFYRMYREFSKKMLIGDPNYFVADINCDLVMKPTIAGKGIKSALTKEKIDAALRTSPEQARREYYNEFTTDAGVDAIFRRGVITRNEETRSPLLYNDSGEKKFIIAYDPARSRDNSVILVMEEYDAHLPNGETEKRGRLVNCINLLDVGKKIKSPMQTPDQIEYLKQVIVDYNGGADNYANIVGVYIDAGSGGAGVNIADFLMPDWVDKAGTTHRGLIDKEYSAEYVKKFPNAVDKVRLMSPAAFKSMMYEAAIELTNQNKISFTANYDNKGYLTVFDIDQAVLDKERKAIAERLKKDKLSETEFEEKMQEELNKVQSVKTKTVKLTWQDEIALANIDALKEELCAMIRKKRDTGKDSFELTPEKAHILHDDRALTIGQHAYNADKRVFKIFSNQSGKVQRWITHSKFQYSCND